MDILTLGIGFGGIVSGALIMWALYNTALKNRCAKIVKEAENEAEVIKKDKILQAKEKFLALKTEHEKEINSRNSKIAAAENKIRQKEATLTQ